MNTSAISDGVVHRVPEDLRTALLSDDTVRKRWEDLTPLARNEWICWTITVKQAQTRENHIQRTIAELRQGKRRPCCWIGCIHRTDKQVSPSVQYVLRKQRGTRSGDDQI